MNKIGVKKWLFGTIKQKLREYYLCRLLVRFFKKLWVKVKVAKYKFEGKKVAHFLHIGKTGGTAIKDTLKESNVNENYALILHDHEFSLSDVPKGEKVIFFVRDPIDRFVSGFYSRKRKDMPRYYLPWSKGETDAFKNFKSPNDLAMALDNSDRDLRKRANQAMNAIYHTKRSLKYWLGDEMYLKSRFSDILFVGSQETLEKDFIRLKKILNLPKNVRLPKSDKNKHKNPDKIDKSLNSASKNMLKDWYAEDYELLEILKNRKTF